MSAVPDADYAWVVLVASFLLQACVSGSFQSLYAFESYYVDVIDPDAGSHFHALEYFGVLAFGVSPVFTGLVCQKVGVRTSVLSGGTLLTLGHVLGSIETRLWLAVIRGFMLGVGGALIFVAANVIIMEWFTKSRGLAAALCTLGTLCGGLVFEPLNAMMLPLAGYAGTLWINGVFLWLVAGACSFMFRRCMVRGKRGSGTTSWLATVSNARFFWYGVTTVVVSFVSIIPVYCGMVATVAYGITREQSDYVREGMSLSSAVGVLGMGVLSDFMGYANNYILCIFLSSASCVVWCFSSNFPALVVFSALYGLSSSGFRGGLVPVTAAVAGRLVTCVSNL